MKLKGDQPNWQTQSCGNDQYYGSQRHSQWQRSNPEGSAGKGYSCSLSGSKGWQDRPWREAVEWNGAVYTKYTFRDGRVEYSAWWSTARLLQNMLFQWYDLFQSQNVGYSKFDSFVFTYLQVFAWIYFFTCTANRSNISFEWLMWHSSFRRLDFRRAGQLVHRCRISGLRPERRFFLNNIILRTFTLVPFRCFATLAISTEVFELWPIYAWRRRDVYIVP